ncbi:MAG: hypothetical protein ACR2J3_04935 [Aridibacter sp.]
MGNETITLKEVSVGTRLLYRAKNDWRCAVVSRIDVEKATLIVCSPTGRTYRLSRLLDTEIISDWKILILKSEIEENWKENFTSYDIRW